MSYRHKNVKKHIYYIELLSCLVAVPKTCRKKISFFCNIGINIIIFAL